MWRIYGGITLGVVLLIGSIWLFVGEDNDSAILGSTDESLMAYFSIRPKSVSQFAYTEGVERETERTDIAHYLVEQLIAGPTESEQEVGFYSALRLNGESNCGGPDFELFIDQGTNVANLRFCRELVYSNRGDEERVKVSIARTLTTLSGIDSVIYSDSTQQ